MFKLAVHEVASVGAHRDAWGAIQKRVIGSGGGWRLSDAVDALLVRRPMRISSRYPRSWSRWTGAWPSGAPHVQMVERMIGAKLGTEGSDGVAYLRSTLPKRTFPGL